MEQDINIYLDNYYLELYYENNPFYLYSWRCKQ